MKAQNFVFSTADKHDWRSWCVIGGIHQSGHFEIESVRNLFCNAVFALADRWPEPLLTRFFDASFDKDLMIASTGQHGFVDYRSFLFIKSDSHDPAVDQTGFDVERFGSRVTPIPQRVCELSMLVLSQYAAFNDSIDRRSIGIDSCLKLTIGKPFQVRRSKQVNFMLIGKSFLTHRLVLLNDDG